MNIRYIVELTDEERDTLQSMLSSGREGARRIKRANILLMADHRRHQDQEIAEALSTSTSTVYRTKRRFVEEGLEEALSEAPRPGGARKLDAKMEAKLVALACSKPPEGRARWTLQLLGDRLVALTDLETVSTETIRRRLKDKELKPWQKKMWCIPKFDAEFVARMEDVLDLYAEPRDPQRPVVCFDEAGKQMVSEVRDPIPAKPGQTEKVDYEYRRQGVANIFLFFSNREGWRHAKVTETKGNVDFAECMRDLVDVHFPEAEVIRVVMDNLKTHRPAALYKAFPPEEARRILRKLEFHYTPKHASWLNMVEIEIGVMNRQCLDRRIGCRKLLVSELAAWEKRRNAEGATINWLFNVDDARNRLARAYPGNPSDSP